MELVNPTIRRWQTDALADPDAYWASAAEQLPWFRRWDRVFDWDPPTFRWFSGAQTNISYNCLDHHVNRGWGGHAALIYQNERGERQVYTYAHLLAAVKETAAALRGLGIGRGDRVAVYLPTCPEAAITMLAATRIGAIHVVVFAGFGSGALGDRIRLSGARAVVTADVTWRKGSGVQLKPIVDAAIDEPESTVEHVVVVRRATGDVPMRAGRDLTWNEFLAGGAGQSDAHEVMEANEPAYILATSGTTARPKLAVHTHGAYQVGISTTARICFGLKETDVWWATADIGWAVGHSHIVYAQLLAGCTTIAYEGALDHPSPDTFYRMVEQHRVSGVFTSPTAARLLMRYGTEPARNYDLSSVERVFCAGEMLNPPAWEWLQLEAFQNRAPVIDHWWQTETGGPVVGNPYGLGMIPIQPGSSGIPLPGFDIGVMNEMGEECPPGEKGIVVIKRPFPGLVATIWGEPERYGREYWGQIPGVYFTGDSGEIDEQGYVWFGGRADEIIKIAGHRIGTVEVESAFLRHPAVAEAGVTGRPDELRGEVVSAFVALKPGNRPSADLKSELLNTVRQELGPVAVIGEINFVSTLPKTRSGKIMRRVFKSVILDRDPGDISTIEDEVSVAEARDAWQRMRAEIADSSKIEE
jgi:acetyl-CoA synthetase